MIASLTPARLRALLLRTPNDCPATCRDIALAYTRKCPRTFVAWYGLAGAYTDLGLFTRARVALKRVEELGRDDPYRVCVRWGVYHKALGDLKRAESWFRRAAAADPAGLVFLGGVLTRQERFAEAKQCFRRATHAPDSDLLARDEAYFNLGLVLRAEQRYRDALVHFDHAIALDPKYRDAIEARADARSALQVEASADRGTHWRQMMDRWGSATGREL